MDQPPRRLIEEIELVWEALAAFDIGVAVLDGLRVADVTDNLPDWFGVSKEDMLGELAERSLSPGQHDFESERREALEHAPRPHRNRATLHDVRGERFEVEVVSASTIDPAVVALARLDERRHVERLLDQLMALVDHIPSGLVVFDIVASEPEGSGAAPDLRLAFANRSAVPILGLVDVQHLDVAFDRLFPSIPPAVIIQLASLAGTTDRLVLDADQFVPQHEASVFECLALGLPGTRIALRFTDLTALLTRERQRLDLQRRLVELGDEERSRLAMAVHDDAIQQFAAAAMLTESTVERGGTHPELERALLAMRDGITALREIVFELRPPSLGDEGFAVALDRSVSEVLDRTPLDVDLEVRIEVDPTEEIQRAALKIVTELLRNVLNHAAASRVVVAAHGDLHRLVLKVSDDGDGFDGEAPRDHFGLKLVEERAGAYGGHVGIDTVLGGGTTVRVTLPSPATSDPLDAPGTAATVEDGGEERLLLRIADVLATTGGEAELSGAVRRTMAMLAEAGIDCSLEFGRPEAAADAVARLDLDRHAFTRSQLRHGSATYGTIAFGESARPLSTMAISWIGRQLGSAIARSSATERRELLAAFEPRPANASEPWRAVGSPQR